MTCKCSLCSKNINFPWVIAHFLTYVKYFFYIRKFTVDIGWYWLKYLCASGGGVWSENCWKITL